MAKFNKISVDEIVARRKDIASDKEPIMKAARSPASWNKDSRSARFVMNAQSPDRYGDRVMTAGIDITEFERNPVALLFHSSRQWPVGSWSNLEKILKGRPPRLEGDLGLLPEGGPVPEIDQTAWMIANGGIRACSIGFRPDWDQAEMILDDEGMWQGGIQWNASELLEASIVSVPASPQSLIKDAANQGNWRIARELLEEVLDNWSKTPEGLLLPRAEFERTYRTIVEKIAADTVEPTAELDIDAEIELTVDEIAPTVEEAAAAEDMPMPDPEDDPECDADKDVETGDDVGVAPVILEVDTTNIEAATEKVSILDKLADSVLAKLARIFGVSKEAAPVPTHEAPPAPPTPEEMAAAQAKAQALRQKLIAKGLIEA